MAQEFIEDTRFHEILELEGIALNEFQQQIPNTDLFVNAITYPDFFNENLVSPNRIIKQFLNNAQSNIRIFYLQLLRLGYEMESEDNNNQNFILNLRRIIFHPQFEILFTQQTEEQRNLYNDFQFKRLFAQFIILLERQQFPQVQQIVAHYSIIDTVFIHIFRSLLASQNINEQFDVAISTEVVFGQLSSLLGLTVTSYGNCWKFQDSDMFCYQQGQNQLYLAYILDDQQVQKSSGQIEQYQIDQQQNDNNHLTNYNIQSKYDNDLPTINIHSNHYQVQRQNDKNQRVQNNYQFSNNIPTTFNQQRYVNNYYETSNHNHVKYDKPQNYQQHLYGSFNYDVQKTEHKTYLDMTYKIPQKIYNYQSRYQKDYKPYQSSLNNHTNIQQNNYISSFKPVDLTPIPNFDDYKPSYDLKKQYTKPLSSYESSYQYKPYKEQISNYSQNYESTYKNNFSYNFSSKPCYSSFEGGDYSKDFTSPDILAKLRTGNRDNINRIRQSMIGVTRGGELPSGFDLKKSAVSDNKYSKTIIIKTNQKINFSILKAKHHHNIRHWKHNHILVLTNHKQVTTTSKAYIVIITNQNDIRNTLNNKIDIIISFHQKNIFNMQTLLSIQYIDVQDSYRIQFEYLLSISQELDQGDHQNQYQLFQWNLIGSVFFFARHSFFYQQPYAINVKYYYYCYLIHCFKHFKQVIDEYMFGENLLLIQEFLFISIFEYNFC